MIKQSHIAILGGGPAGLSAAYFASKKGLTFHLFEAGNRIGGICQTISQGDFRFDLGAHRLHDKEADVTREIKTLLGDDLFQVDIPSQIYSKGRFIDFPLSPLNAIRNIGPVDAAKSGFQWIISRLFKSRETFENFEEYAIFKYGRPIAERFLLNYSEKLWGLPCNCLSTDISGSRLKGLCLTTFLLEALVSAKAKTEHLDGVFYYPRWGFGQIVDKMTEVIGSNRCHINAEVTRILHQNLRIHAIEINHEHLINVDQVVSSLPLTHLVAMLDPACPEEILQIAGGLSYRRLVLVMLVLNKDRITRYGTVYFPDSEFPFNRISEPKNRSPWMAPQGKTSLIAEIPTDENNLTNRDWIDTVIEHLVKLGWMQETDVIDSRIEYLDYAYPVLDIEYPKKLERIMDYLDSFQNLKLTGRNSMFQYAHFHDMMRSGMDVIDGFVERKS